MARFASSPTFSDAPQVQVPEIIPGQPRTYRRVFELNDRQLGQLIGALPHGRRPSSRYTGTARPRYTEEYYGAVQRAEKCRCAAEAIIAGYPHKVDTRAFAKYWGRQERWR